MNPEVQALVTLAIGTVDAVITEIQSASPATTTALVTSHHVALAKPPKNKTAFKKAWNKIVASDSHLVQLALK